MSQPDIVPAREALRASLCAWLVGGHGPTPSEAVQRHGVDAILAAIDEEGVISLLEARLHAQGLETPAELLRPLTMQALACRARAMRRSLEVTRIQQTLDDAGVRSLWLKGAALAQWLYPLPTLRDVADVDLLLPNHATALQVAELLAPLGYTLPNPHIAGDLIVHELLAISVRAQLELDLHWDLSNSALFANRLHWHELAGRSVALPAIGAGARGFGGVDALLHACMHRATNAVVGQQDRLRWLYDIHLLAARFGSEEWEQTEAIATRIAIAGVVHDGLIATQAAFATVLPAGTLASLAAAARNEPIRMERLGSWTHVQWATLVALPRGRRLRWLRQLLFPDIAHLRVRYGTDGAGQLRILSRRLSDGVARWRAYVGL